MNAPHGMSIEQFTKHSKLFEFLDGPGRERMAAIATKVTFNRGDVVVVEGEVGDSFFVIVKGSVTVSVDDLGTEKQVATLGAGTFFGEIAVVTDQPRSATVTAATPLELLRFDKAPVQAVLKDYPRVRELLAKMGVRRTEDTMEKMLSDETTVELAGKGRDGPVTDEE